MSIVNKWKELDHIKTPENWKNISFEQDIATSKYHFSFIIAIVVFLVSLTTVVAYHNELEEWINSFFQIEDIHKVDNSFKISNKNLGIDEPFAYEYDGERDNIQQVYLVKNHQFQDIQSSIIKTSYHGQKFSFQYVTYKNHIFAYQYQGYVYEVLPIIMDNHIYMVCDDQDLLEMDLETQQVKAITTDHESVNPIMSPNGKTILINKNDQYWTVYDTEKKTERKVDGISAYAHSNEICYYDDYTIFAYSDESFINEEGARITIMNKIDLKTLKIEKLSYQTDFARPLEIKYDQNEHTIHIRNVLNNNVYDIKDIDVYGITECMTDRYVLFYNYDFYYLYSINHNEAIRLQLPKEIVNITDICVLDDSQELLISDENNYYFIDIDNIFDK